MRGLRIKTIFASIAIHNQHGDWSIIVVIKCRRFKQRPIED
jgi:hypothetical protein